MIKEILRVLKVKFPENRITKGSISNHAYIKVYDVKTDPNLNWSEFETDKHEFKNDYKNNSLMVWRFPKMK